MAEKFLLEVVTPERKIYGEQAQEVSVPGIEGRMGILAHHAPLITGLDIGVIKIVQDGQEQKMAISGGFMEVTRDKVIVLADAAELADEIDVLRAKEAMYRAEKRLKDRDERVDLKRAQLAMIRALARLEAAGELKK